MHPPPLGRAGRAGSRLSAFARIVAPSDGGDKHPSGEKEQDPHPHVEAGPSAGRPAPRRHRICPGERGFTGPGWRHPARPEARDPGHHAGAGLGRWHPGQLVGAGGPDPAAAAGRRGRKANGAMETPTPARSAGTASVPGPASPAGRCWSDTSTARPPRRCSTASASSAPATRSWSAGPTGPPAGSWSAAWSSTPRPPCPATGSGPGPSGPLLRLITCAGSFDKATGHYRDN